MLKLLPGLKDCDILADKAYGAKEIRTYLHDQSARYTIPPKVNTKQPWPFDKETYKRRNVIERFFNRLKEFRRAETRYDLSLIHISMPDTEAASRWSSQQI